MKVVALVGENVAPVFELSGMQVVSPSNSQDLLREFQQILLRKDLAMLVISARFSLMLKQEIENHRISKHPLIILEISSSQGDYKPGDKLMQYIKKVIGQS